MHIQIEADDVENVHICTYSVQFTCI